MSLPMDRAEAWVLLCKHTQTESLRKHALCVEGAMRHLATVLNEDAEYWGMVGLLHDLDYEKHPDEHCTVTPILLKEAGFDDEFIRGVLSHGWGLCTDVEPMKTMEKVIYAIDELTGLVTACALMRPTKSVIGMEVKSVKKKFKQASFASAINRELIQRGADMIPMPLEELMGHVIDSLCAIADEIGMALPQE